MAFQSNQCVSKTCKQVRKRVSHTFILFLKQVECDSPGFHRNVKFSKIRSSHNLSGLFREDGLTGVFETFNLEKVDQASSFLGAISDIFWTNEAGAYSTKVFEIYVDLLVSLSMKVVDPGWTDEELHELQKTFLYSRK